MMSMAYIRKTYGVPAKRGMKVVPTVGPAFGCVGIIRSARNARLVVSDAKGRDQTHWGIYHPKDLNYLPPNTHYPNR